MSRRERQRRRRHHGGGARKVIFLTLGVLFTAALIGTLSVVGYVISVAASAPDISSLKPIDKGSSSVVYAADGSRLGFIQSDELRTPISSQEMPQSLRDATVAIEDERFFKHKGVDYAGVVRAALENLRSGKTVQGGSTITMQLVRNLYISRERTFQRKIREAKLAEELENVHDKGWILTTYLNTVSYGTVGGQTAVGVQAAARTFFDKPASELELHEAALLAGLPQAPSLYNPFRDPKAAKVRRDEVLRKMADLGMITRAQSEEAIARPLGVRQGRFYTSRREGYFFDYVKQELIERYGVNTVRGGGLKIYTTIDLGLQRQARKAMAGQLNQPGDPSAAIVTIDPRTGYIKAMASSARYDRSKFNLAAQGRRQPGSTFKVMVLMTALRRGVDPNSTSYVSKPLNFTGANATPYGPWKVSTYSNSYGGRMNLVRATLVSDNTVYAQLDLDLGPEAVRETAYDMGIRTKLDAYPAEGLGGLRLGVSPLEMANAYATIASGGWRNRPIAITKVVFPDGKVEELGDPKRTKAFEDGVTYEATKILRQNILGGTGTAANIGCPAAGKTGTTDNFNDAWFVGFTPKLATAVWVGYPNAQIEMRSVHGIAVAGGTFPARIWRDYMIVAKGSDCSDFPKPDEQVRFAPFFGKYATTGAPGDYSYDGKDKQDGKGKEGAAKDLETQGRSKDGGGRPKTYDPDLYEAPPQPPPKVVAPPAETPPGHGTPPSGGTGAAGGTAAP